MPVPSYAVIRMGDRRAFASRRVARNVVSLRAGLLEVTENAQVVPDLLAFDVLVGNQDRQNPGNTIFARSQDNPARYRLYTIDHSWSGLRFYADRTRRPLSADSTECTTHYLLWGQVGTAENLRPACDRIRGLNSGEVSRVVAQAAEHSMGGRFDGLDQVLIWRVQGIHELVAAVAARWGRQYGPSGTGAGGHHG